MVADQAIYIMIPLFKVFSLLLRVFSKPLLNYTKKVHSSREAQSHLIRRLFIRLGNSYHKFDSAINRSFLKINSQFAFKPLSDQLALQKGIQFFYQLVFYCIVLGLPTYQIWKGHNESVVKECQLNDRLAALEEGSQMAVKKLEQTLSQMSNSYRSDWV